MQSSCVYILHASGTGIVIRERREQRRSPPRGHLFLRRPRARTPPPPVKTIPYGYDVPSPLRIEHDGDSPGFLAAIADSVTTIERDSPGYLAAIADSVATATASSSSGGASCSRAPPRHDGASTSLGGSGSSSAYIVVDDDDGSGDDCDMAWLED